MPGAERALFLLLLKKEQKRSRLKQKRNLPAWIPADGSASVQGCCRLWSHPAKVQKINHQTDEYSSSADRPVSWKDPVPVFWKMSSNGMDHSHRTAEKRNRNFHKRKRLVFDELLPSVLP